MPAVVCHLRLCPRCPWVGEVSWFNPIYMYMHVCVFPVSMLVGAAMPAVVCRLGLCPRCPGWGGLPRSRLYPPRHFKREPRAMPMFVVNYIQLDIYTCSIYIVLLSPVSNSSGTVSTHPSTSSTSRELCLCV